MKSKIKPVLSMGVFALCLLVSSLCGAAFAAAADAGSRPRLSATDAPSSRVQVGVVAQRFPWNGMVDVTVRVSGVTAESGATLTVTVTPPASPVGGVPPSTPHAEPIEVIKLTGVKNGEQTVSFNANDFDALKGKKLNDVKIAAKVE